MFKKTDKRAMNHFTKRFPFKISLALLLLLSFSGCKNEISADFRKSHGSVEDIASFSFAGADVIDQVTDSSARVAWTHSPSAVAYDIYLISPDKAYRGTVSAPTSDYTITGLSPSTNYKVRVKAKDEEGRTDANTNDLALITLPAPPAPTALALSDPSSSSALDTSPALSISGVKAGDTIKVFTDSACSLEVGSKVSTGPTIEIETDALSAGVYTLYAASVNSQGNYSGCSSASVAYEVIACPTGYIVAPGNSDLGVRPFCVMQFEAKNDGGSASSREDLAPWASISQNDAKTECADLGPNYDLISNAEWMSLAYDIEEQGRQLVERNCW